jgi:transcriptional regulator with XRE-family HTH domain
MMIAGNAVPHSHMPLEDDHRAFIVRIMDLTGWTQTELAQRAGLDPSTLSRFLSGSRSGHALRASTIRKLEAISGLSFGPKHDQTADDSGAAGFAEPEAVPLSMAEANPLRQAIEALSRGKNNNIDPWTLRSRALEGAGYRPGDILLVALGETPIQGDVVCAQIYDWTKGRAETVFRLFQPPFLVAATTDTNLMRPFVVDDGAVSIKGIVIHTLRERTIA